MRGQSAMEYLITYGWAILIVTAVLVLLINMGYFTPTYFVGVNTAYGLGAFAIADFKVVPDGTMTLYIINNAAATLTITDINIDGTSLSSPTPSLPYTLEPGENLTITGGTSITGEVGTTFTNVQIQIIYDVEGGASGHLDTGVLQGRIDPA